MSGVRRDSEADFTLYYIRVRWNDRRFYKIGVTTNDVRKRFGDDCSKIDKVLFEARVIGARGIEKKTPSVVLTSAAAVVSGFTLGLDLGDRSHHVCVLDATGQMIREGALPNTRPALAKLLAEFPRATVAMEAGTHSPWISRYLTGLGAKVIVANPRRLQAISRHERKCDRRDALVRTRVNLINAVRFTLKSLGQAVRNPSSESFHKTVLADIPADCLSVIEPLLTVLAHVTQQIKTMERDLVQRGEDQAPRKLSFPCLSGWLPISIYGARLGRRPAAAPDSRLRLTLRAQPRSRPDKIRPNAGGPRQFPIPTPQTARVGQFCR